MLYFYALFVLGQLRRTRWPRPYAALLLHCNSSAGARKRYDWDDRHAQQATSAFASSTLRLNGALLVARFTSNRI